MNTAAVPAVWSLSAPELRIASNINNWLRYYKQMYRYLCVAKESEWAGCCCIDSDGNWIFFPEKKNSRTHFLLCWMDSSVFRPVDRWSQTKHVYSFTGETSCGLEKNIWHPAARYKNSVNPPRQLLLASVYYTGSTHKKPYKKDI